MARYYETSDPRFLDLVRRIVYRAAVMGHRGITPRRLAKTLGVPEEDAEAALIKLKERGDIVYGKKRRKPK